MMVWWGYPYLLVAEVSPTLLALDIYVYCILKFPEYRSNLS